MKKKLSPILIIVLAVVSILILWLGVRAFSQWRESKRSPYTITEPYSYPILQGSEEWFAMTNTQERTSAYLVPNDVISNMTTEALMLTVMANPFFTDIAALNLKTIDLEQLSRRSVSGLAELFSRPDFCSTLEKITLQQFDACLPVDRNAIDIDVEASFHLEIKLLKRIYNQFCCDDTDGTLSLADPFWDQ